MCHGHRLVIQPMPDQIYNEWYDENKPYYRMNKDIDLIKNAKGQKVDKQSRDRFEKQYAGDQP